MKSYVIITRINYMRNVRLWLLAIVIPALVLGMTACPTEPETPPAPPEREPTPPTAPSPTPEPEPEPASPETKPQPPEGPPPEPPPEPEEKGTVIAPEFARTFDNHFGFMPAHWDFEKSRQAGGAYDRPFFELFQWGMIERSPGHFDFNETDRYIKQAQSYGLHILANLQPFAVWDQSACHSDLPSAGPMKEPGFSPTKGKPCDMEAYRNFIVRLVERYDGDGIEDMPGLTMPIKHWEMMNEPEFQEEPLIFFQGSPGDYFDTLKVTYEAVKSADPEAFVVQGGMAGMMEECTDFWQPVFDLGGTDYLDIMNMHSIGHGEHLNIPAFKQFLAKNGLQDKPFWVTEVQFQQAHQTQNYTNEDFAMILARSYVFALANGVDKLFYVNIRMPPRYDPGIPFDERSALVRDNGEISALFQAHATVASILGELSGDDTVEIIRESIGDWHIDEGQYRFTIGGKTIYALWGNSPIPADITGEVRVIDITGTETAKDAASLRLTDSPVFIVIE